MSRSDNIKETSTDIGSKPGIIFDVDGTLWDACRVIADSWNEYIRMSVPEVEERATEDMIRSLCGQTMDRFAAVVFPDETPERGRELTEACCIYEVEYLYTHSGNVYPGLEQVLQVLKAQGYPLYIVSNCQKGYIEAFLHMTGYAKYFDDFEHYGRTGRPKDENIRLLCERNHLDQPIYLGDTQGDCNAARAAGAKFIHAAYGFGRVDTEVPSIHALSELPEAVAQLVGE